MINILAVGAGGFLGGGLCYGGSEAFGLRFGLDQAFFTFSGNILGCLFLWFLEGVVF